MGKRTFVYGAVILLAANLLNRILGFLYQYLIMTHIGGEAYGLFSMVFPVYMLALVFTTAGIPLAVAKMVAEAVSTQHFARAKSVFRLALTFLCASGLLIAVLLYLISPFLADRLFPDPRVFRVFQICTPAIFIVSLASAFRGYFQGLQNMLPTAISQIFEQITRVSIGFIAASLWLPRGIEWAAAGLALGMLCGEAAGLILIMLQYYFRRRSLSQSQESVPTLPIIRRLFQLAAPVTAGRLISSALSTLDAMLIPHCLQVAGYSAKQAVTLFGQLGGATFTLLNFPSVFTFALATSLVPAISEATARQHHQSVILRSSQAIRSTILIAIPSLTILFFFAEPLSAFFKSQSTALILRILALGGIFSYLQQTTAGILQGLGKVHLPVLHTIISAGIRIPLLWLLTSSPEWGLKGTALAYVIGYVTSASLNLFSIIRYTGMPVDLREFVLYPLTAGMGMIFTFRILSTLLADLSFGFIPILGAGGIAYLSLLLATGTLNRSDLQRLPWLGKYIHF